MKNRILFYFICVILLAAPSTHLRAETCQTVEHDTPDYQYRVEQISVSGLERTARRVVDNELLFEQGDVTDFQAIEKSIQRLRNTSLFRKVAYRIQPVSTVPPTSNSPVPAKLHICVDERWTLIGIFEYNSGGGVTQLTTGLRDINVLGQYLEMGAVYERLGSTNSGYGWISKPQFLGYRLSVGLSGGVQNKNHFFYTDGGAVEKSFLLRRRHVSTSISKEWKWWLYTSGGVGFSSDRITNRYIPEDLEIPAARTGTTRTFSTSFQLSLGRIDEHNYRYDGFQATTSIGAASDKLVGDTSYVDIDESLQYFELLPLKSNVAANLSAGTTTAREPQHLSYLGGLGSVRGYGYAQYSGDTYWVFNTEFRIPSFDTKWFVLQHTAFFDAGNAWGGPDRWHSGGADGAANVDAASAGLGLRIIVPKIHTFLIRVDYAFPLIQPAGSALSYGAGQFL